jgi:hypothetical protein
MYSKNIITVVSCIFLWKEQNFLLWICNKNVSGTHVFCLLAAL